MDAGPKMLSRSVCDRLRRDIMDGTLAPGEKLRIENLSGRYGVTGTPVREALNQLAVEGFVQHREQRGFCVAVASLEELAELTDTRCWVEAIALREAIARRSVAWEENIVLAYHRLVRTPRSLDEVTFLENPAWEAAHRAFHMALIATCPSRWLIEFCGRLSDHAVRYRRLGMLVAYPKRDIPGEHQAIMQAAIDGKAPEAAELLTRHYQLTAQYVSQAPTTPSAAGVPRSRKRK